MARVTVEDCLDKVDNRFQLVLIASKRARQLALGAESQIDLSGSKVTVSALREIAEGLITPDQINAIKIKPQPVIEEYRPDNNLDA